MPGWCIPPSTQHLTSVPPHAHLVSAASHRQALGLAWDIRLPTEAQKAKLAAALSGQAKGAEADGADMAPAAKDVLAAAGIRKD